MTQINARMTDKQTTPIGVTILDQDRQPFLELPEGVHVTFTSDNEEVCAVDPHDDGMNADITSGKVGTANITVHVDGVDPAIPDDIVTIEVVNSQPGSLNTTVGMPVDEPE